MKTKERILNKALELFNEEGVKEVTLRRIAGALEISQGNLNYHYKTKAEIISALYFQLVSYLDEEMNKIVQQQSILSLIYESSYITMKTMYDFRFILKDFYSVLNADSSLKDHYLGLQQTRKQQYLYLFGKMTEEGLIREAEFESEYDHLYERMNILGDNWINAAELFQHKGNSMIVHYHKLLFEVIYPYLTEKGKSEYFKLAEF